MHGERDHRCMFPFALEDGARKEFYSALSHLYRTPLMGACGYVDFVIKAYAGELNEAQREKLSSALGSLRELEKVIDTFMDLIAFELGLIQPGKGLVDLSAFLGDLSEELKTWAASEGCSISLRLPRRRLAVKADVQWLHVLVHELVSNAIRVSPKGGDGIIAVELSQQKAMAVLRVCDRGPGAGAEQLKRMFRPLLQPRRESDPPMGARGGMGLALADHVVRGYGGCLRAQPLRDAGLAVIVELPLALAAKRTKSGRRQNRR